MTSYSDAALLNRVAQGQLPFADAVRWFESLPKEQQQPWLQTVAFWCHQSHPLQEEIAPAMELAKLKPTFTPCVMLVKARQPEHVIERIASLPSDEHHKAFRLIFALYCIADTRRRKTQCKNGCYHEWHNLNTS